MAGDPPTRVLMVTLKVGCISTSLLQGGAWAGALSVSSLVWHSCPQPSRLRILILSAGFGFSGIPYVIPG